VNLQPIQNIIYEIRGQYVMLDFDLAGLYGVETRRLKEMKKNYRQSNPFLSACNRQPILINNKYPENKFNIIFLTNIPFSFLKKYSIFVPLYLLINYEYEDFLSDFVSNDCFFSDLVTGKTSKSGNRTASS
jgi:hypothetical protein